MEPDPRRLAENRKRMRFYERYGVRPIVATEYETPIGEGAAPYLLFDGLGRKGPLRRSEARAAGLYTPPFAVVERAADVKGVSLNCPLFVKPLAEGTGNGVDARSRVNNPAALAAACRRLLAEYRQPVLVEEYLPGREFTVGVLGSGDQARALGTLEVRIRPAGGTADYCYEMKERCEELVEYVPLAGGPLRSELEQLALAAHVALQCRDASRTDARLDAAGRCAFMEINVLPGLHPTHSDLPMIAAAQGLAYHRLIGQILRSAMARTAADAAFLERRVAVPAAGPVGS